MNDQMNDQMNDCFDDDPPLMGTSGLSYEESTRLATEFRSVPESIQDAILELLETCKE